MSLENMFNPKSIAIIGASNTPGKVGFDILKNLIDANYKGDLFPVNLKEQEVQGVKTYSSILEIKKSVDLAILVIPAQFVPSTINDCAKKKIKNAIIISAGFSETGAEGKKLEDELKEIITKNQMNVVGPNTLGIINTENGLNASFAATFPSLGSIAVVSQSGALCTAILDWSRKEKIGFSKFISTGNKSFLNEKDYFSYLENDPKTSAVFVYMESVKNEKEFLESAYSLSKKKPIVLIKSGRSNAGRIAASSHTGAISCNDELFTVACKKANILRANSIEGFFDMAKMFSKLKNLKRFNLAVVTNAGGPGVIVADSAENHKFPLPKFSEETLKVVKEINPHASNPLDLIGDAKPIDYRNALAVLQNDKNIDLIYALVTPQSMTDPNRVSDIIIELNKSTPIMCSFIGGVAVAHARRQLRENGVIEFETPERGIKALSRLKEYTENKKLIKEFKFNIKRDKEIEKIISKDVVSVKEGFTILDKFGIKTCKTFFVENENEFDEAIKKLNFPIALKAASGIAHKTDLGLVNAKITKENAKEEYLKMQKILVDLKKPKTIAVQEMIIGQEVLVSSITNEFGKVITYGLGGIFVEVMKDVSQKIAPLCESDIEEMFDEVKGTAVLKGARTKKVYNIKELKKLIMNFSILTQNYNELKEIEINPVIVNETGAYAVDIIFSK
ncbi:MAG: acetate--CoA ligase family protein [Candidatus ainarchaeum sp.]|nr:acetate--CoA ligase family protein [Candidatus ainarchaeum sp.]